MDMSQHFTAAKLLRFTLPVIGTMVFSSIYGMVDGFFVSRWCGSDALAAVNFTFPIVMVVASLGFMLGTGGSAIVAKTRGEGDGLRANRQFSLVVYSAIATGVICAGLAMAALEPVLQAMGAVGDLLELSLDYGLILSAGLPLCICQQAFQELAVTAGRPKTGFAIIVAAGVTNAVLDALFIMVLGWGIRGAALATVIGQAVGAIAPVVYFALPNGSALRLGRTSLDWCFLGKVCVNGSSEMVSSVAMSIVGMAYNVQLLAYLGEEGVAAYGVIMYAGMAVSAVLMGFVFGSSPLMSYQYGAASVKEMKSLFSRCVVIVAVLSVVAFVLAQVLARPLAMLFVGYNQALTDLTVHAARIYACALLLMGFSMYASGLFTALGNGKVSAAISFVRTLLFEIGAVMLLPMVIGPDGIWWSIVVAEIAAVVLSGVLAIRYAPRYGYLQLV